MLIPILQSRYVSHNLVAIICVFHWKQTYKDWPLNPLKIYLCFKTHQDQRIVKILERKFISALWTGKPFKSVFLPGRDPCLNSRRSIVMSYINFNVAVLICFKFNANIALFHCLLVLVITSDITFTSVASFMERITTRYWHKPCCDNTMFVHWGRDKMPPFHRRPSPKCNLLFFLQSIRSSVPNDPKTICRH